MTDHLNSQEKLDRRTVLAGMGSLGLVAALSNTVPREAHGLATEDLASSLARLRHPPISRGSSTYEIWRQSMIWQYRKAARFPELIVQAESVGDVVAAVRYAAKKGLRIATRCGGHSMSACFLRDRGLLLDVSRLASIELDVAKREAQVGPGIISRELNERLRRSGLAFPTAHCGMVPISGFLLGGGLGLNGNAWGGLSTFNIKAVEIVTADGTVRTASANENPDLYWAVRGGGPGLFGVVTRFHLTLYDLPKAITGHTLTFKFSDLSAVSEAMAAIGPRMSRQVEFVAYTGTAATELSGKLSAADSGLTVSVDANAYARTRREAYESVRPLFEHPVSVRAIARELGRDLTLNQLYFEEEVGFGNRRYLADNVFTNRVGDVARLLLQRMPQSPAKDSHAVLLYKGSPALPDAACSRIGDFYASFYMQWDDASQDRMMQHYLTDLYQKMTPLGVGSNINEMNQEGRVQDIAQCYSAAAWRRLSSLRSTWDPNGVFHDFYGVT